VTDRAPPRFGIERPPPSSICIVRLGAIGDLIQTLPLASALKAKWPDAHLTWVAPPLPAELLRGSPSVDEILHFRPRRGLLWFQEIRGLRQRLRTRTFDVVLVPELGLTAGLAGRMVRSSVRVGPARTRGRWFHHLLLSHRVPKAPLAHRVEEVLDFARSIGVDIQEPEWSLRLLARERDQQTRFFQELGEPACGVIMGTGDGRKDWPPDRWSPVINALAERWGLRVILLGGPGPRERLTADGVISRSRGEPVDELGPDLRRLMWLVDGCRLVLGPDTGLLHLAAAMGTPVVGLFGYTNPRRFGPRGQGACRVADGYSREPGEELQVTEEMRRAGMARVTPRMVLDEVEEILDDGSPRSAPPEGAPYAPDGDTRSGSSPDE
jgi:heptosyltransferase I